MTTTKKLLIGVGILAGAGLAYYLWKRNSLKQDYKINWKDTDAKIAKETGIDLDQVVLLRKKNEGKSNIVTGGKTVFDEVCYKDCSNGCALDDTNCFTNCRTKCTTKSGGKAGSIV